MQALLIDALDRLHQCPTQEARWACGVGLLRDCGSDWMTAGTASRHAQTALAIRSTTPESLMGDYVAERIYLDDPWMQLCANTSAPDHLEVDAETGPTGRPEKTRMSRLFSDHGIKRAVLVPCYGGDRPGVRHLGRDDADGGGDRDAQRARRLPGDGDVGAAGVLRNSEDGTT